MPNVFDLKKIRETTDGINYDMDYISLEDTCCAVYVNEKSEVLLVRQYRPILGTYSLEIPGGSMHKGETAEEAAKREFNEETGLTSKSMEKLFSLYLSVGTSNEQVHLFLVREIEPDRPLSSSENGVVPCWITKSKCLELVSNGGINDAKTIIALQKVLIL